MSMASALLQAAIGFHVASLIGQREADRPDLRAERHIPLADAHFVLTPKTSSERQSGDEASLHLFVPEIARNGFCGEFARFHQGDHAHRP